MNKDDIKTLRKGDEGFPDVLNEMEDPVKELYCIGDISLLGRAKAAVVGARKCSEYGRQAALCISRALAERGVVTVSGMAVGIDGFAHSGAISRSGGTIAVLGCGPDVCYPDANRELYKKIKENGLVISEYPPGTRPSPWRFPMRNRIIAALSSAVIVVEAGENSGAAITAVRAAEMGKEVFALPGNVTSPYSIGANRLIRDGARIITSLDGLMEEMEGLVETKGYDGSEGGPGSGDKRGARLAIKTAPDVAEETGTERPAKTKTRGVDGTGSGAAARTGRGGGAKLSPRDFYGLSREERRVYEAALEYGGATVDILCEKLGKSPSDINGAISMLEIKGMVYYELGKIFIAKF